MNIQLCSRIVVLAALLALTLPAQAAPIEWTIDALFDDDATLTGTFTYDGDTNTYIAWDLITSDGAIPGSNYSSADLINNSIDPASSGEYLALFNTPPISDLVLNFAPIYDESVVQRTILATSFEAAGGTRQITQGTVVQNVVPIPAAAWLFGSALGLLGWMRRKAA